MNEENILPGQKQKLEIHRAIQESSYFLILLSEKSLSDRGYFHKELKIALEILDEMPPDKIYILPVRLDACKPPYENLQNIQHTDLFPSYEEGFRQVVRVLESPGDEKESRFVDKRVLGTLTGIRVKNDGDSVFAKDKAGIVKVGTIGDSAKVELGYKKAAGYYKEAAELLEGIPDSELTLAGYLQKQGDAYYDAGMYAEVEKPLEDSLKIRERLLGKDHEDVASALHSLGRLYYVRGRYDYAVSLHKRALAINEKVLGPEDSDLAVSLNELAVLYRFQGRYNEAEPLYKRSLSIAEKSPEHPSVAATLNNFAALYYSQSRYEKAEPLYKRSLAIYEKSLGPDHPSVAITLNNLAVLYKSQGRYEEAEPLYRRSLVIYEKSLGPDHPSVATTLNNLASLYESQGRYEEIELLYTRSLAITGKTLGPSVRMNCGVIHKKLLLIFLLL